MAKIKIDDTEYDLDKMSDAVKAQMISLQYCDHELQRLQMQAAALQTARMTYARALKEALEGGEQKSSMNFGGDTIKFS